jgi:hypothetical protein
MSTAALTTCVFGNRTFPVQPQPQYDAHNDGHIAQPAPVVDAVVVSNPDASAGSSLLVQTVTRVKEGSKEVRSFFSSFSSRIAAAAIFSFGPGFGGCCVYIQRYRGALYVLRETPLALREALCGLRKGLLCLRKGLLPLGERLIRVRELFYPLRKPFAPLREALPGLRAERDVLLYPIKRSSTGRWCKPSPATVSDHKMYLRILVDRMTFSDCLRGGISTPRPGIRREENKSFRALGFRPLKSESRPIQRGETVVATGGL